MSSLDECRRQWSLEVSKRGRIDIIVWMVPCYDPFPDDTRRILVLRPSHDDPIMTIPKQQQRALKFLMEQCGGEDVLPRPLLVIVWYEKNKVHEVWGIVSTGTQFRHPDVVFRNECRLFPPPPPSRPESTLWSWTHIVELQSPHDSCDDDRDMLACAIRHKGRLVHKLQQREPLTK
jgi:hypothetical protein